MALVVFVIFNIIKIYSESENHCNDEKPISEIVLLRTQQINLCNS